MTLPPASANRSRILALTSGDAPQPQSSPKVMVPSATSEIRTPVLPKSLYRMRFPHFFGWTTTSDHHWPEVLGSVEPLDLEISPLYRRDLRFTRQAAEALLARRRG